MWKMDLTSVRVKICQVLAVLAMSWCNLLALKAFLNNAGHSQVYSWISRYVKDAKSDVSGIDYVQMYTQ